MRYHNVAKKRQKLIYTMTNLFLDLWVRISRNGLDNVSKALRIADGKGIIFAIVPHLSYLDVLFVPALISKRELPVRYIASAKFFTRIKKKQFYMWGAIPAEQKSGKVNVFGIEKSCHFLNEGINIGVFPQARFPAGKLKPLHMRYGVVVISQQTGAPIVIVHISGTGRVGKSGKKLIPSHEDWKFYCGLSRIKITFHDPVIVYDYGDENKNRAEQKEMLCVLDGIVKKEYPM